MGPHTAASVLIDWFGEPIAAIEAFTPLEGQTIVDIGAHIGSYTLLAANRVGKGGKVVAIEAHPSNYQVLLKNLLFNGFKNVVPVNVAASNHEGRVKLYLGKDAHVHVSSCHSTVCDDTRACSVETEKYLVVPCMTLDRLLAKICLENVDWIKIDVESAELDVLKGMRATLRDNRRLKMMVELHHNHSETISFLKNFGLNVRVLATHEDGRQHIFASYR
jgi:FkbM family methyltransferase